MLLNNNNDDLMSFNIVHRPDNIVYLITNPNISVLFHIFTCVYLQTEYPLRLVKNNNVKNIGSLHYRPYLLLSIYTINVSIIL